MRKPSGLRLVEYATADGTRLSIEVSPEIALALADDPDDPGARLKETTFTDLGRWVDGRHVPLKADALDPKTARRRIDQRPMPEGNPWEGPRFHFSLLLGEGRPMWLGGGSKDDLGRCGVCHGAKLPGYAYCLDCDRSGRDREIPRAVPKPPEAKGDAERRAYVPTPKKETRKERRAREAAERRKAG